jgi:hypothetical protein
MASIEIQHQFPQLQSALQHYIHLSNLTADEVLEKKGKDLGFRLYKGFRAARWRGSRNINDGIAFREMRRRAKMGQGTDVRLRRIDPRWEAKIPRGQRITRRGVRAGRDVRDYYPTSLWQRLVAQELLRRQVGMGVLAASFLWVRRRTSRERGTYYVRNKPGRVLGYVEKGDGMLRIVGLDDALSMVDARYGIVRAAVQEVTADTMQYVEDKISTAFGLAAEEAGLSA